MATKKSIKFNPKQLRLGINIEHEHTRNNKLATKIAKDHLREYPQYYTYLIRMEKHLKKRK
jgi:hypothetical protein